MASDNPVRSGRGRAHLARALVTTLAICTMSSASSAGAQAPADSAAIRTAACDYIQGWYDGDAARMERAVHPALAKRIVETNAAGASTLDQQGAADLIAGTRGGGGRRTPKDQQRSEIRILDVFGNAASVRVDATSWVDYLHLAKVDGRWVIINVLWELRPRPA
jgi:hypothetical protein